MTDSPGARAVAAYKIQDIFLVAADCWVVRDFNQSGSNPEITYGHQTTVEKSILRQVRISAKDETQLDIVRYFITTEVRLLKPGVPVENRDPLDEEFLARIRVTFAADYSCPHPAAADTDSMSSFSRNAHFHAWPYIREEISAFCGRLRIPRVVLPMWNPDQPGSSAATEK